MKIFKGIFGFSFFLFSVVTQASIVAIVDSGTDTKHKDIAPYVWNNPGEIIGNDSDDDGNQFADDIHGWNFVDNNNILIDRQYVSYLTPEVRRFFRIQTEALRGTASDADIAWAKRKVKNQSFLKKLITYATFSHGTHVGGIALKQNPEMKLLSVKLIPTPASVDKEDLELVGEERREFIGGFLLRGFLHIMAKRQTDSLKAIVAYLVDHDVDVINFSFGIGFEHGKTIVTQIAGLFGQELSEQEEDELTRGFIGTLLEEGKKMAASAPDALFVMAAGNDGLNNDEYPSYPANIGADNTISVAATFDEVKLAKFSSYGTQKVEIAAPGVGINSTVPGNEYLTSSGTSQAAPMVAGIASMIKDANPELTPKQIKEVLMNTVTSHSFLEEKVTSGGIVNSERASAAAKLSLTMDLKSAIGQSFLDVPDTYFPKSQLMPPIPGIEDLVLPLPSSFILKK